MTNIRLFLVAAIIIIVFVMTLLMVLELADWMRETVVIVQIEK